MCKGDEVYVTPSAGRPDLQRWIRVVSIRNANGVDGTTLIVFDCGTDVLFVAKYNETVRVRIGVNA